MLLSHFLKVYPSEDNPGHLLLFSTKQASKILIKKETFQSIEQGTLSPADQSLLLKMGMITQDREEEKQNVLGFFDRFNEKNRGMDIIAVLNLDCNFACKYCFEGDMKGRLYMSDQTGARLIDFIKERFTEDMDTLLVDFYGGEPLLSLDLIKSIY